MKNHSLTVIFLLGLATMVSAQDDAARQAREAQRAMMRSPAMQQARRNAFKQMMGSFWNGNGSSLMAVQLFQQDDFREGVGVSKEQSQKLQDSMQNIMMNMHNDPDFRPIQDEMGRLMSETGGPFSENSSEETLTKFFDLQTKMQEVLFTKMNSIVNESLAPDQLKKVKEFQISMMSEMPIVSPGMFEALDLSDSQKKQLDEIKKEMEPEFLKSLDKMIDSQMKFSEKFQDALDDKLAGVTDHEEQRKIIEAIVKKIREENPDIQREEKEMLEDGKLFTNKLKFRMFDVLTDEQMERMAQLIDNPPDYVRKAIAQIRKQMGHDDSPVSESGEWKPGPNSWKPGDPIPEEYLQQRQERRFPRKQ